MSDMSDTHGDCPRCASWALPKAERYAVGVRWPAGLAALSQLVTGLDELREIARVPGELETLAAELLTLTCPDYRGELFPCRNDHVACADRAGGPCQDEALARMVSQLRDWIPDAVGERTFLVRPVADWEAGGPCRLCGEPLSEPVVRWDVTETSECVSCGRANAAHAAYEAGLPYPTKADHDRALATYLAVRDREHGSLVYGTRYLAENVASVQLARAVVRAAAPGAALVVPEDDGERFLRQAEGIED